MATTSSSSQGGRTRGGAKPKVKVDKKDLKLSEAYLLFKESVALQRIVLDSSGREIWEYYDAGPKTVGVPLVMIPPMSGSADCFFLQSLSLSSKGYRVISCTPSSCYNTPSEWVRGMNRFLEAIHVAQCHLLGAGLGCYLALCFAQSKPKRVKSFIATNGYVDNQFFLQKNTYFGAFSVMPGFLLEKAVLSHFPRGPLEMRTVRSVDFMVEQTSRRLKSRDLCSRLTILASPSILKYENIDLEDKNITIIDTLDDNSRPEATKEEIYKFFPGAQQAQIKNGGEFPYLSRSSDFNMYLQVHLRKHSEIENRSLLADVPTEILPFELNSPSSPSPSSSSSTSSPSSSTSS